MTDDSIFSKLKPPDGAEENDEDKIDTSKFVFSEENDLVGFYNNISSYLNAIKEDLDTFEDNQEIREAKLYITKAFNILKQIKNREELKNAQR